MERTATWSGIGTDVIGASNLNDVLKRSNLDYNVKKVPVMTQEGIMIPGRMATVRESDNHVFGIVSDTYEVCQNREAFDFVNYIQDDIKFVKAGETLGGMIYIIAELPQVNVLGDSFKPNVIFQNGHNGGISIRAAICPLRIVCQNQFNWSFKNTNNTVTIRHTSTMEGKLVEARSVLATTAEYMNALTMEAEKLASSKISEKSVYKLVDEFFPVNEEATIRSANTIQMKRDALISAYLNDDNQNFRGTVWGLINAYSDYITHSAPSRKTENWMENKFTYVTFNPVLISQFVSFVTERA